MTIKQIEGAIIDRAWDAGWCRRSRRERLDRQEGRRRRLRPGRAGRRPAAHPRRAHRHRLRARRPDRRAAPLRHPRVQDGEAAPRPAAGPDARRGHPVPHRRRGRRRASPAEQLRAATTPSSSPIGATVARDLPIPGRELAGIHLAMEYLPHGQPAGARRARSTRRSRAERQARRDHRRRRHRRRLPRHGAPAGRGVGHPARDHAAARRDRARQQAVADLPDDLAGLQRARGGRRRGSTRSTPSEFLGDERRATCARCGCTRSSVVDGAVRRRSRAPSASSRPTWCCSRWASPVPSSDGARRAARRRRSTRAATSSATRRT